MSVEKLVIDHDRDISSAYNRLKRTLSLCAVQIENIEIASGIAPGFFDLADTTFAPMKDFTSLTYENSRRVTGKHSRLIERRSSFFPHKRVLYTTSTMRSQNATENDTVFSIFDPTSEDFIGLEGAEYHRENGLKNPEITIQPVSVDGPNKIRASQAIQISPPIIEYVNGRNPYQKRALEAWRNTVQYFDENKRALLAQIAPEIQKDLANLRSSIPKSAYPFSLHIKNALHLDKVGGQHLYYIDTNEPRLVKASHRLEIMKLYMDPPKVDPEEWYQYAPTIATHMLSQVRSDWKNVK